MRPDEKLTLVTRRDLSPGYQAVQSCHALRQFTAEHPDVDREWFAESNFLALLAVDSEPELHQLVEKAEKRGIRFSVFREPDVDYAVTAVALEPSPETQRLCRGLKLALQEPPCSCSSTAEQPALNRRPRVRLPPGALQTEKEP